MSYGIDEKEEFLLERKLDELVSIDPTTGALGRYNPDATSKLDRRALAKRPKPKKPNKTVTGIGVNQLPAAVSAEPIDDKGLTFIPPPKPKPKPKPKPIKTNHKQPKSFLYEPGHACHLYIYIYVCMYKAPIYKCCI